MNITSGHTSNQFEQELQELHNKAMDMGALVERQVRDSVKALIKSKIKLGRRVESGDDVVDRFELDVDEHSTRILALRQPAAGDLRFIFSIIKATTDMERIGDEAKKIAQFSQGVESSSLTDSYYKTIKYLGKSVIEVLERSLSAFARMDVEEAKELVESDREVDEEFENFARLLVTHMMENPQSIQTALNVLWSARSLERISDHAINLCEYVVFMVEGKDVRHANLDRED